MQKIVIGSDHAAFDAKAKVIAYLKEKKFEVEDLGTYTNESTHYPIYAKKVSEAVLKENIFGILLCGSGIGVSMTANRFKGIRAALCRGATDAEYARKHNDANVLCLGARFNTEEELKKIIDAFFSYQFEGGRHSERVKMFTDMGETI